MDRTRAAPYLAFMRIELTIGRRLVQVVFLALITGVLVLVAGCGKSAAGPEGQTEAEQKVNNLQAIAKIADAEEAINAAERQLGYLAAGLWERSYADVHPAQQVLFTESQYAECMRKSYGGGAIISAFEARNAEKTTVPITGTSAVESNAVVVAASYTIERDGKEEKRTQDFKQTVVDGQWRFTVPDPEKIASGSC